MNYLQEWKQLINEKVSALDVRLYPLRGTKFFFLLHMYEGTCVYQCTCCTSVGWMCYFIVSSKERALPVSVRRFLSVGKKIVKKTEWNRKRKELPPHHYGLKLIKNRQKNCSKSTSNGGALTSKLNTFITQ